VERRGCERSESDWCCISPVVDPPTLAPQMDSSVEKVSSDPWFPCSIRGPNGGYRSESGFSFPCRSRGAGPWIRTGARPPASPRPAPSATPPRPRCGAAALAARW
jgi:hypothetical protein